MVTTERFPAVIALTVILACGGFNVSGVPLMAFALRFPDGKLSPKLRWADMLVWSSFGCGVAAFTFTDILWLDGYWNDNTWDTTFFTYLQTCSLAIAGAIFVWRFARSGADERAKTAWAIAGFLGSILCQTAAWVVVAAGSNSAPIVTRFGLLFGIEARGLDVLGNLFPLLAIYPILRYRLFDLGFVINRAALYSVLTLAAVGTLAGVNWLAQHWVTERLALVLQPVAAIVIGLGFARARGWTQTLHERTLFRDRFAAEMHRWMRLSVGCR